MSSDYSLEIYQPGSPRDVWVSFDSNRPFGNLSRGDIIHSHSLPDARPDETISIARIEHIFWQAEGSVKHKIMVYTERSYGDPEGLRR